MERTLGLPRGTTRPDWGGAMDTGAMGSLEGGA